MHPRLLAPTAPLALLVASLGVAGCLLPTPASSPGALALVPIDGVTRGAAVRERLSLARPLEGARGAIEASLAGLGFSRDGQRPARYRAWLGDGQAVEITLTAIGDRTEAVISRPAIDAHGVAATRAAAARRAMLRAVGSDPATTPSTTSSGPRGRTDR